MYLPEAIGCKASVALYGCVQKNEEEKKQKENPRAAITNCHEKKQYESYYTKAKRVSELHDLLGCHHRANGEGVQMPVGDILQVESREGRWGGPRSRLLYLLDRWVPLE